MIIMKAEDMVSKCIECGGFLSSIYSENGTLLTNTDDGHVQLTSKCRTCGKTWEITMKVEEV